MVVKLNHNKLDPKEAWYSKVRVVEARTDIGSMFYLVDENYNFIEFTKEFLDMISSRSNNSVSPNTLKSYCYDLRYFIIFLNIKNLSVLSLDGRPDILVDYKLWLKNPFRFYENVYLLSNYSTYNYKKYDLKDSTINQYIDRVSSLYLWLKATNKIKENPVIYRNIIATSSMRDRDLLTHTRRNRKIQINSLKSKPPKVLPKTIDQNLFTKFLNNLNLLRDKIILLCLKEGGFRASELLGIHLEDIDFAEQGLWVRFRPNNSNLARAKSGYGKDRFVNLSTDLMALIDTYISTEWIESNPNNDFLFVVVKSNVFNINGKAMTKSTLDSMFRYYSMKTFGYTIVNGDKIPKYNLHPHMLRHTHATELAREYIRKGESVNWKFISMRLGHSSITTTIEIYSHLKIEDYKKEYYRLHINKNSKNNDLF